jgi:hypothetical protein
MEEAEKDAKQNAISDSSFANQDQSCVTACFLSHTPLPQASPSNSTIRSVVAQIVCLAPLRIPFVHAWSGPSHTCARTQTHTHRERERERERQHSTRTQDTHGCLRGGGGGGAGTNRCLATRRAACLARRSLRFDSGARSTKMVLANSPGSIFLSASGRRRLSECLAHCPWCMLSIQNVFSLKMCSLEIQRVFCGAGTRPANDMCLLGLF